MEKKYLAKEYPTIESAATEIVNLSAIGSLPKGTEFFFSDIHGEYEAYMHMLRSASGRNKSKIDLVLSKSVSQEERERLAVLICDAHSLILAEHSPFIPRKSEPRPGI